MRYKVTYDGIRGNKILYRDTWNIVVNDKVFAEAYFRLKARKTNTFVTRVLSIEEIE